MAAGEGAGAGRGLGGGGGGGGVGSGAGPGKLMGEMADAEHSPRRNSGITK